ncbi:Uncharacterised protein [Starkeya nomas]|uniref:Uncharacterized protein n=1 Tax=Starkeya nomas TaxID=2666134 RepID=A0A5S9NA22_9HYPH|nr:hypothetical protein [Starkeya nomas]CAA0086982.1 Uncharacterised protein [Starkeya nomas]
MIVVHPTLPLADGIAFDDMTLLATGAASVITARRLLWLTEFSANGRRYGGTVLAASESEAHAIADSRGLSEVVIGLAVAVGEIDP